MLLSSIGPWSNNQHKQQTFERPLLAETDLKAVAQISPIPQFDAASELLVTVTVMDADNQTVFRAVITMWVSPKKEQMKRALTKGKAKQGD